MKKNVGDDDIAGKMAIWILFLPALVFTYKKPADLITFASSASSDNLMFINSIHCNYEMLVIRPSCGYVPIVVVFSL